MNPTGVLCAVRGAAEARVVRALGAAGLTVARRCADLAELLSAAAAGLGEVAVVSADLPGLDREAVHHLHGSGVGVVVLADQGAWPVDRALRLGADETAPVDEPDRVVEAVGAAARRLTDSADVGGVAAAVPDTREASPLGRVVAVWGPTGAPGRTTVALGLAEALAGDGVLLVDADTYGGTVAPMIGMLDEAPGLAAACRSAGAGRLGPRALGGLAPTVAPGLRVLSGISRPERWPELSPAHLEEVWEAARRLTAWTVVDCGFAVERDEALSYDTRAPRRNGATLSALAGADLVVVVGAADPIGLQRLVRGVLDLPEVAPTAAVVVVVNKVRASVAGRRPEQAIREALARYAGVGDVHLLPWDPDACDAAVLSGRLLGERAPTSTLHRRTVELAGLVRGVLAGPEP